MNKKKNYIKEMHLYSGMLETLSRDAIWCLAWIGGIHALQGADDQIALANAYFIFSAPYLLDFAKKTYTVKRWPIRIFYAIWTVILFFIFINSFAMFLNVGFSRTTIIYGLSVSVFIYTVFDVIVGILTIGAKDESFDDKRDEFVKHDSGPEDVMDIFSKNLFEGGLGSVKFPIEEEGDQ